eukprot:m.128943 g.128943  ORF g.128943 m.128943 type:complete len:188 (+) comp14568_c0_seq6:295-858(+)
MSNFQKKRKSKRVLAQAIESQAQVKFSTIFIYFYIRCSLLTVESDLEEKYCSPRLRPRHREKSPDVAEHGNGERIKGGILSAKKKTRSRSRSRSPDPSPRRRKKRKTTISWSPQVTTFLTYSPLEYDRSIVEIETYNCDHCGECIFNLRYNCPKCEDFDICVGCYEDEGDDSLLVCGHAKTDLVAIE